MKSHSAPLSGGRAPVTSLALRPSLPTVMPMPSGETLRGITCESARVELSSQSKMAFDVERLAIVAQDAGEIDCISVRRVIDC